MATNKPTGGYADELVDDMMGQQEEPQEQPQQRSFQVIGDTKIPVSKSMGKLWKSRRDQGKNFMENLSLYKSWDEVIAYYKNDQSRSDDKERQPGRETGSSARRFSRKHSSTENIVFANVSALIPATYAKNPDVEVTAKEHKELEKFATACERLVNVIFRKRISPGINLKPKLRRGVVMATLTNLCYFDVGYVRKENSSEQVLADIEEISMQLEKEKDIQKIMELEGQLQALQDRVSVLDPSGPYVKFRDMRDVIVDPACQESDFSDARYMMVKEMVSTEMLRALYGRKNEKGEYESIYYPTHVIKLGTVAQVEEELIYDVFKEGKVSHRDYGYSDEETFRYAQMTAVWYVWDKSSRRVYLFNEQDWCWPLWVWDDPYQFDNFFSLEPFSFYTDPETPFARSEVMYYLDQQDEINKINSEIRRAREFASGKFLFNEQLISQQKAEQIISEVDTKRMVGVKVDPEVDIRKLVSAIDLPSIANAGLWDKTPLYSVIDRLSSVTAVMRGTEYKTNTTNKAIESYESQTQTRLDEKIDAIEDVVGRIGWKIIQLCVYNMPVEEVVNLIGEEYAQIWAQYAKPENLHKLNLQIVGGSAIKPTARSKKEEAVQVGQILGQFANASPAIVLLILRMFQRAFDEVTVTEEDWDAILEGIDANMQKGRTDGEGGSSGGGGGGEGEGGPKVKEVLGALDNVIDKMPPEIRQQLGQLIAEGAKPSEAIEQLVNGG